MLNIYVLTFLGICNNYEGKHTCLPYNMLKSLESPLQFTVERSGKVEIHVDNFQTILSLTFMFLQLHL